MSKVFSAHAVSVDGCISGRESRDGKRVRTRVFDDLAWRVGAVVAGRAADEHSADFGGGSPHPGVTHLRTTAADYVAWRADNHR